MSIAVRANTNPTPQSNGDTLNQIFASIEQKFQAETASIAQLQTLINEIVGYYNDPLYLALSGSWITQNFPYVQEINQKIAVCMQQIQQIESSLESSDPSFSNLDTTLNNLLSSFATLQGQHISLDQFTTDVSQISSYLSSIISAMQQKVIVDKDTAFANAVSNDPTADPNAIIQYAEASLQAQTQEFSILGDMENTMRANFSAYHQAYDNADADESSIHWWDCWFGDGDEERAEDERIKRNATAMETVITTVLKDLTPELSSLTPDFALLSSEMDDIYKKILEIWKNTHLSSSEKLTKILSLVMGALTLVGNAMADNEKDKDLLRRSMAQATADASQMNIQDALMNATKLEEDRKYASIMGSVMKIGEAIAGFAMAMFMPGFGSMLAVLLVTALEASGVMDEITKKIAQGIGSKVGADVIVGAIEVAFTLGAGAAADAAMKAAEETALQSVNQTVTQTVRECVEEATAQALNSGVVLDAAGKQVIENSAQQAAETASKKALTQFFKQNGLKVAYQVLKGAKTAGTVSLKQAMAQAARESIAAAAESAAKNAAREALPFAEKISLGGALSDVETEELANIVEQSANQGVASATNSTSEQVAKSTGKKSLVWELATSRATLTTLYALGTTNLLPDLASGSSSNSKEAQALQIFLTILRAICVMLATAGAGGMTNLSGTEMASYLTMLLQAGGTGAQGVSQYGQYEANTQTGNVEYDTFEQQAAGNIYDFDQEELGKAAKDAQKKIGELSEFMKSYYSLSSNLWNSEATAARVLAGQAV